MTSVPTGPLGGGLRTSLSIVHYNRVVAPVSHEPLVNLRAQAIGVWLDALMRQDENTAAPG